MKALFLKKRIAGIALAAAMVVTNVFLTAPVGVSAASGTVSISESAGWFESAYAEWKPVSNAKGYVAYVKGASQSDSAYVKLDDELIRQYSGYWRADAVGLAAGKYIMKIAAVDSKGSVISSATTSVSVSAYDRSGFAFSSKSKYKTGSGAYNDNGTLKSGAIVLYVTPATAATVTTDVITNAKGGTTTCKGIQTILAARQKGYDTRPLDIRIVGCVTDKDVDYFASSSEGIQIKGKAAYSEMNITIEGIGEDAAVKGFGFLIRNCGNLEMRNFAVLDFMDDGISLDTNNCNVWVHNVDLYYGQAGSDSDQKKGDGSIDIKAASTNITVSYCHFYDSGKCSLCGMSDSSEFLVTYHHNWFDHSDSRHARIRVASVHLYNNYFDGNAKYGVGTTKGSSAFVEANYFRNCKYPMMSSLQGTDKIGDGTFSGEAGGMIKAYGNVIEGAKSVIYANSKAGTAQNATSFDAYLASSRTEKVPASYKTVSGGTVYNNFDTSSSYDLGVSASKVDPASNVPAIVKKYAGRMNGGDLPWTFSASEDEVYAINTSLKNAVVNYKSPVVAIGGYSGQVVSDNSSSNSGNSNTGSTNTGSNNSTNTNTGSNSNTNTGSTNTGSTNTGNTNTGNTNSTTTVSAAEHNFTTSGLKSDVFSITGNLSTSKGTVSYNGMTLTQCLKMESSTSISFTTSTSAELTVVLNSDFSKNVKIDGENRAASKGVLKVTLAAGSHTIKKADSANIYYIALGSASGNTNANTGSTNTNTGNTNSGSTNNNTNTNTNTGNTNSGSASNNTNTNTGNTNTGSANNNTNTNTNTGSTNTTQPEAPAETQTTAITAVFTDGGCWGSGYVGNITITNSGNTTIKNWTVKVKSADSINNVWGASLVSKSGSTYEITNAGYNCDIAPGESVSFGFTADCKTSGKPATPAVTLK